LVPEAEGKTIRAMRLMFAGATGETEFSIDFLYRSSFCDSAGMNVLRHQLKSPAVPFREFSVASAVDAND
jgi:hypothetical protein